jgi:ribosomal protein L16 Arg81 hydroxylase
MKQLDNDKTKRNLSDKKNIYERSLPSNYHSIENVSQTFNRSNVFSNYQKKLSMSPNDENTFNKIKTDTKNQEKKKTRDCRLWKEQIRNWFASIITENETLARLLAHEIYILQNQSICDQRQESFTVLFFSCFATVSSTKGINRSV